MPLGEYGYEPFPEEEEEPERPERKFNVLKIGLWLLGIAALGIVGSCALALYSVRRPSDLYTPQERAKLDAWLTRHESETTWIQMLAQDNISGKRVFFWQTGEDRVYRISGLSMDDCVTRLRPALISFGFDYTPPIVDGKLVDPKTAAFQAVFENDKLGEEVTIGHAGNPIMNDTTNPTDSRDIFLDIAYHMDPLPSSIQQELGFDPVRTIDDIDWNQIGPPAR